MSIEMLEVIIIDSHARSRSFIVHQGGAPAHVAHVVQDWLQVNCLRFIEKNHWSWTLQIWTYWTIKSGSPCWISTVNCSWSPRWLVSWKSLCRPSGKRYQKNTSTRQWQTSPSAWLPVWLPMLVTSSISSKGPSPSLYPHFSTRKLALFRVTHILPEKTTSEILKSSN